MFYLTPCCRGPFCTRMMLGGIKLIALLVFGRDLVFWAGFVVQVLQAEPHIPERLELHLRRRKRDTAKFWFVTWRFPSLISTSALKVTAQRHAGEGIYLILIPFLMFSLTMCFIWAACKVVSFWGINMAKVDKVLFKGGNLYKYCRI